MATTATLTGTFTLPNDAAPDSAVLSVIMSAMDTDQNTRDILMDDGSFTVALVAGAIPAGQEIWKNTAGLRGTHYRATLAWTASDGRLLSRYLGSFQVGDDASYDMADLLDQPPIATLPEGWYSTLTQGDYDAAITARDEAVAAAAAAAEDAAATAEDRAAIEAQAASYVTLTGSQTLTNKTINLSSNTLVATSAQLRSAVTDETGTGALVFAGSPALTGTPTAPTAAQGTSTTQVATTAFVTDTGVTLTRAQLVTRCAAGWRAVAGQILWADGDAYIGSTGATATPGLPGLLPAIYVSPRHMGAKCDGSDDTAAILAAWNYYQTIQVDGGSQYSPVTALPFKWNPGVTRANSGPILTMTGVGATMIGDGEVSQVRNVTIRTENAINPRIRNFEMRQVLGKAISSIADNGAGKIRVTTTAAHGLTVGEFTRVNGSAAYDDYEARVEVLAVVSTTVVDLDRAYVAPAGAQGVLGGDAIILGPGTSAAYVTDMHLKEIAGVALAYDGAEGTRTARNHVEKSMYGMALLEYGAGNYDEGSNFETCQRFCIDIRTGGEFKPTNTRGGGAGANNVNDAGGWATMRILGLPSTVRDDGPVEHYYTNVSLSGSQNGGRRYSIVSIADNGAGKLRITTATPHELCVGNHAVVLTGTASYDASGAESNVLAVISDTVFDLDRTYVSSAGAVGQVWYDGWDLLIQTVTPLPNAIQDQKFVGGNINKTKIDGGYKVEFIGTRLKESIYLTDNTVNNRIMIVGDGRGRANASNNGNTMLDIPVYGPGSHRGWSRLLSGIDNPTSPPVNGGERLVLQAPYTAAGVGADSLPKLVENGVNKDGILWRVNGKEATVKEAGGILTLAGVVGSNPGLRATVGGTASAITLTTGSNLSGAIPTGTEVRFRATAPNPGAATVSVDGGPPADCRTRTGVALPSGYIRTDVDTIARYDGTYWVLSREVEQGSNANGTYIRWEDGTQICRSIQFTGDATTATGALYKWASNQTWTYPAAFSAAPVVSGANTNNVVVFSTVAAATATECDVNVLSTVSSAGMTARAVAQGNWF